MGGLRKCFGDVQKKLYVFTSLPVSGKSGWKILRYSTKMFCENEPTFLIKYIS